MSISINEVSIMKKTFDDYKHVDENGKEYWNSHELSKAMGYTDFRNFNQAIDRAKIQMINTGVNPNDHLVGSNEMIKIGKGGIRKVNGYKLDKYAAYNVSMNADPHKEEVAFAQQYFLNNTAKVEYFQKRMSDKNYIENRNNLKIANTKLAGTLLDRDVKEKRNRNCYG